MGPHYEVRRTSPLPPSPIYHKSSWCDRIRSDPPHDALLGSDKVFPSNMALGFFGELFYCLHMSNWFLCVCVCWDVTAVLLIYRMPDTSTGRSSGLRWRSRPSSSVPDSAGRLVSRRKLSCHYCILIGSAVLGSNYSLVCLPCLFGRCVLALPKRRSSN